ncbi:hypothetical protein BD413DRAFT_486177 [Trametes elegans]|nr:hypothetical protein BD413DRAFT_486177 [Trametes elegans]
MSSPKLSPQAQRWRVIMFTVPIIGVTSFVLYKRLILGEPRRELPTDLKSHGHEKVATIFTTGKEEGNGAAST